MAALLRLCTAGHVDDGKSTLIGRLLYDTRSVPDDQLASVGRASGTHAGGLDFSLFTDGLRAEREQGITIDVAYRYFSTPRRAFILADSPGHEQYTRNMATAASSADAVVLLADARHGVRAQTKHHARIARQMGVKAIVVAVNKMDLVGFDRAAYDETVGALVALLPGLALTAVPVSARLGDNIVNRSARMPWYHGPTLLEFLESTPGGQGNADAPLRLPIQLVLRHEAGFRGYAGQIVSGTVRRGDRVTVWPHQRSAGIHRIIAGDADVETAMAPQSIVVTLDDEVDVGRGAVIATTPMHTAERFAATVVWMDEQPSTPGRLYILKSGTRTTLAELDRALVLNEVADVGVSVNGAIAYDAYQDTRATGGFILIDPQSHFTAAAGMIVRPVSDAPNRVSRVGAAERLARAAREARTETDAIAAVNRFLEDFV